MTEVTSDTDRDYAIVVGIDHYPNHRSLEGAIADAEDFYSWVTDKEHGGAIPDGQHHIVLSKVNPTRPIQDDIDDALEKVLNHIINENDGEARRIYFYFSGHGMSLNSTSVELCLAKWSSLRRNAALASQAYLDMLTKSGFFQEVLFFLDCCRVVQTKARGKISELEVPGNPQGASHTYHWLGFASSYLTKAYEGDVSNGASNPKTRGYFTEALLRGLRGAATKNGMGVEIHDLKQYLEEWVPRIASQAGKRQTPRIFSDFPSPPTNPTASMVSSLYTPTLLGKAKPSSGPNLLLSFKETREGQIRLYDPHLEILKEDDKSSGPWELELPKGTYIIEEVNTQDQLTIPFLPGKEQQHVTF